MRYHANVTSNLLSAAKAKDDKLFRDIVLDELSTIIEENPFLIVKSLRNAGEEVSDEPSKKVLIDKTIKAIHKNKKFHVELAKALKSQSVLRKPARPEYANAEGEGGGSSQGGSGTEIVSSIASMLGSAFAFGAANQELKASEKQAEMNLYNKILGTDPEKKTNWIPILAIGGVLIIGGLVVWKVLGNKKG